MPASAKAWLALALAAMLSGCVGALVVPMMASGPLLAHKRHVRAATEVKQPRQARSKSARSIKPSEASQQGLQVEQFLQEPLPAPAPPSSDPWQKFFAYALANVPAKNDDSQRRSVLLIPNPPLDNPALRPCPVPIPAVVIDLDDGAGAFDPQRLTVAPPGVAEGLVKLRATGVVILWISQLPASRAADIAQALQKAHLDPGGTDQFLLIRNATDRKQLLRSDALEDVCIVAMAGDERHDFDELFDYLRHPDGAGGLDTMLGSGWFLVPSLDAPAAPAGIASPSP